MKISNWDDPEIISLPSGDRFPSKDLHRRQGLTVREHQVLEQLADGFHYKEISTALGIGVSTVRAHAHSIYVKLNVRSRAEAAKIFHTARQTNRVSPLFCEAQ